MRRLTLFTLVPIFLALAGCGDDGGTEANSTSVETAAVEYTEKLEDLCGSEELKTEMEFPARQFADKYLRDGGQWFTQADYEPGVEAPPACDLRFVDDSNSQVKISIDRGLAAFNGTTEINPLSYDPAYTCKYSQDFVLGSAAACPLAEGVDLVVEYQLVTDYTYDGPAEFSRLTPEQDRDLLTIASRIMLYELGYADENAT